MSTTTVSVGRYRLPALAVVVALVAAIALAVLAVADVTRTSSTREVSAPAANHAPTPYWLQRYLEFEAPTADYVATPYWLQRYLEFEAPGSDSTSSSGQEGGTRPPNEGLR
jgi:hypothetical protein